MPVRETINKMVDNIVTDNPDLIGSHLVRQLPAGPICSVNGPPNWSTFEPDSLPVNEVQRNSRTEGLGHLHSKV